MLENMHLAIDKQPNKKQLVKPRHIDKSAINNTQVSGVFKNKEKYANGMVENMYLTTGKQSNKHRDETARQGGLICNGILNNIYSTIDKQSNEKQMVKPTRRRICNKQYTNGMLENVLGQT